MENQQSDDLLVVAQEFDLFVDRALDEREKRYGFRAFEYHHLRRNRVETLIRSFIEGGVFPSDRLPGVTDRAIDVKLQIYLTGEVGPGLINEHYYNPISANAALVSSPSLQLIRLALHQDLIVKSRILWDRIMGLIYHLDTGKDDLPRSGRRSAKRFFFEQCASKPMWRWLQPYEGLITDFDEKLRTPEVHKRSTLRSLLVNGGDLDSLEDRVLRPFGLVLNQVWENIESIVGGGGVVSLGLVHMRTDDEGRPVHDASAFDRWGWSPSNDESSD